MTTTFHIFLVALAAAGLSACSASDHPENPEVKRIYSVLQAQEYSLRNDKLRREYVYSEHALGTNYNTIAFPDGKSGHGYIVFLANARDKTRILSVPAISDSFKLSRSTYNEITQKGLISIPVQRFLHGRTTGQPSSANTR
jgi:hypothetical protein